VSLRVITSIFPSKEVNGYAPKHPDRWVQKTCKLLQDALSELVAEQGYESVTIQEILDKANAGRSTFYAHFQDKEQLLHSILEHLDELFEEHEKQLHGIFTKPGHDQMQVLAHLNEPFKVLKSHEKYDLLESEIAAHYFVSALMGVLVWWVGKMCLAQRKRSMGFLDSWQYQASDRSWR
jgi:AcrR family transcriptional regulator